MTSVVKFNGLRTFFETSKQILFSLPCCIMTAIMQDTLQQILHFMSAPTHIDLDCHIVHAKLQQKLIHLLLVSSVQQLTDVFTKPLDPTHFYNLISEQGLLSICDPTCGGYQIYFSKVVIS